MGLFCAQTHLMDRELNAKKNMMEPRFARIKKDIADVRRSEFACSMLKWAVYIPLCRKELFVTEECADMLTWAGQSWLELQMFFNADMQHGIRISDVC